MQVPRALKPVCLTIQKPHLLPSLLPLAEVGPVCSCPSAGRWELQLRPCPASLAEWPQEPHSASLGLTYEAGVMPYRLR